MQTTILVASAVVCSAIVPAAMADIVIDQSPPSNGAPSFFSNAAPNSFTTQLVYDNFTLATAIDLSQVTVWGYYDVGTPATPQFRVRIYGGTSTTLGSLVQEQAVAATATPTGLFDGAYQVMRYDLFLTPSQLVAGEYWLSVANTVASGEWGWSPQNTNFVPSMRIAFENRTGNPAWASVQDYDRAFQIIPTPGIATMLGLAAIAGYRRRR